MRKEYELSNDELAELLRACQPTPCMMIGDYRTPTPQENANFKWKRLAEKLGFNWMSVRPVPGKGIRYFTADALNDEDQVCPACGCTGEEVV